MLGSIRFGIIAELVITDKCKILQKSIKRHYFVLIFETFILYLQLTIANCTINAADMAMNRMDSVARVRVMFVGFYVAFSTTTKHMVGNQENIDC